VIRKIAVKNFRSLKDVVIDFEEDITVLVGENDSGKTSVVEVLKILFDNKSVEIDDFSYGKDEIYIEVDTINENFDSVSSIVSLKATYLPYQRR
jgi:predicted ATP-dependent endonuclease of OLD family